MEQFKHEPDNENCLACNDTRRNGLILEHRLKVFSSGGHYQYNYQPLNDDNQQIINFIPIQEDEQDLGTRQHFRLLPQTTAKVFLPLLNLGLMVPDVRHMYNEYLMKLLVIDEPLYLKDKIELLVQDHTDFIGSILILNYPQLANVDDLLGYGCRMLIKNFFYNGKQVMVLNSQDVVCFPKRELLRCRVCGETGSSVVCSVCKKASYCSQECQALDWYQLRHQLVCLQ